MEVRAEIRPTEDLKKVVKAVRKIFPDIEVRVVCERGREYVVGTSSGLDSLDHLRMCLRSQRILDAARASIRKHSAGNVLKFMLNKQAALVGVVNFTDGESPLGPIVVEIETDEPEKLLRYIAPPTIAGKPVE